MRPADGVVTERKRQAQELLKDVRRLDVAIKDTRAHITAICQIRCDTPGRAYYLRKLEEGKTKKEAIRALKRRLSDAVYRQLRIDAARAKS